MILRILVALLLLGNVGCSTMNAILGKDPTKSQYVMDATPSKGSSLLKRTVASQN